MHDYISSEDFFNSFFASLNELLRCFSPQYVTNLLRGIFVVALCVVGKMSLHKASGHSLQVVIVSAGMSLSNNIT